MSRLLTLAVGFAALAATAAATASAQEVVTTSRSAPPSAIQAAGAPAADDTGAADMQQVVHVGPCTPHAEEIKAEALAQGARIEPDRAMHGQVTAGIGTGGYRHADATVCKPIGANSSLTVHLSDTQGGDHRRW